MIAAKVELEVLIDCQSQAVCGKGLQPGNLKQHYTFERGQDQHECLRRPEQLFFQGWYIVLIEYDGDRKFGRIPGWTACLEIFWAGMNKPPSLYGSG